MRDRELTERIEYARQVYVGLVAEQTKLIDIAGGDVLSVMIARANAEMAQQTAGILTQLLEFAERPSDCQLCDKPTKHDPPSLCVACSLSLSLETSHDHEDIQTHDS